MKIRLKIASGIASAFLLLVCSAARADFNYELAVWNIDNDVSGNCSYVYPPCWAQQYYGWAGYYVGLADYYGSRPCGEFTGGCDGPNSRSAAVGFSNAVASYAFQEALNWANFSS
ncbi:MAG: hypothetical protein ABI604_21070 [Nitrospirota bacterium]